MDITYTVHRLQNRLLPVWASGRMQVPQAGAPSFPTVHSADQQQYQQLQPAGGMPLGGFPFPGPGPSPGTGHLNVSHGADLGVDASTRQPDSPDWAAHLAAHPGHTPFAPVAPAPNQEVLRHPTTTTQPSHLISSWSILPVITALPRFPYPSVSVLLHLNFRFSILSCSCAFSQSPPRRACAHFRQPAVHRSGLCTFWLTVCATRNRKF